ncbi:colicin transporter [Cellulomonas sp. APG4]|nr:colicin transporter [Cellulomonas sp. APG4]
MRPLQGAAPLPPQVDELLARSDAELVASQLAQLPGDRYVHAHLAALRAGAALLEVTGRPRRRPAPRTVWDMVAAVSPELSGWTAFFASGASLRAAVEAGRDEVVDAARADQAVAAAEDFQDAVREAVGAPSGRLPMVVPGAARVAS